MSDNNGAQRRTSPAMQRIEYAHYGGPEQLHLAATQIPEPGKGQVRVQVRAASANPMDWKIRRGEMKFLSAFRFPRGLGHDFSGVIDAIGPGNSPFKRGDEIFGVTSIPRAGSFAEYVIAEQKNVGRKPASVSFDEAAALAIVGMTAWNGLIAKAKLVAGQTVFINGCLGNVGRSAAQIAAARGAKIVGSCDATRREEAVQLGVSESVDYHQLDPLSLTGKFDIVFDTFGSLSLKDCSIMLKPGGMSLHIVPNPAKTIGCLLSRRHNLVFGNPSPEALEAVADASARRELVAAIGLKVPLQRAIPALIELEETGSPKGKLIVVP